MEKYELKAKIESVNQRQEFLEGEFLKFLEIYNSSLQSFTKSNLDTSKKLENLKKEFQTLSLEIKQLREKLNQNN